MQKVQQKALNVGVVVQDMVDSGRSNSIWIESKGNILRGYS